MSAVTLTLRAPLAGALDLAGIVPDRVSALAEREIAALPVRYGGRTVPVGELFRVAGERSRTLRLEGDLARARNVGAGMRGGEMAVAGNVGDGAGVAMAGGTLAIEGSAGARLGAARPGEKKGMTGGEIAVRGSAGPEAGAELRRGLIAIGGDAGDRLGLDMIAGTAVVFGRIGVAPGQWSRRGSIVALGAVEPPATYRLACVAQLIYLRVLFRHLGTRYRLPVESRHLNGFYRRYSGDLAEVGKGEILAWTDTT